VSPIIHAHIDGDNDFTYAHPLNTQASMGVSFVDNHNCQTISTSRGYRLRDITPHDHTQISSSFSSTIFNIINVAFISLRKPSVTPSSTPHLSPWSQAPPRFIQPA
jgi:hypothetical protein